MMFVLGFALGCLFGAIVGLMYAKTVKQALSDRVDK